MNVRPAGREACSCASPYNSILERLTAMEAEILTAMQEANTAVGIANTALAQVQAAGIRTVNQIQPDADGEFSITAGTGIQINAGMNGIEIENTSQGSVYTGIAPITISSDNEISLDGWTGEESSDWRKFIVNNKLDKNLILLTKAGYSSYERCYYIPKGFTLSEMAEIRIEGWDDDSSTQTAIQIPLRYLLSNTSATSDVTGNTTTISESNGVITHDDRVSLTSRVNRIGWTSTGGGGYNMLTVKLAWRD